MKPRKSSLRKLEIPLWERLDKLLDEVKASPVKFWADHLKKEYDPDGKENPRANFYFDLEGRVKRDTGKVVWYISLLEDLGYKETRPVELYEDWHQIGGLMVNAPTPEMVVDLAEQRWREIQEREKEERYKSFAPAI